MLLQPLTGWYKHLLLLGISLVTFMQVLDSTIANVAIPTIAGNLGASTTQGTWVITGFGVANAIAVPITGWLSRQVGEVRLFLIATGLFIVTSFLCGLASSLPVLVSFRALQGLFSGPIIPLAQTLLLNHSPSRERSMVLAIFSMIIVVAPILGPLLGGWISDTYHWGWIFFINVPIGCIALLITAYVLRNRESKRYRQRVDSIGLAFLILGVGAFQLLLDRGKELDWFASKEIIAYACLASVGLFALVAWVPHTTTPIVDLSLFSDRNFTIGVFSNGAFTMMYMGAAIVLPLLLQTVLGYSATQSGMATAPIGLFPFFLAPIIGRYSYRLDMRWLVTFSFVVIAMTFYWRSTSFCSDMCFYQAALPQFVQGIGIACLFMPLTNITLSRITPSQLASAAALSNFLRTLSGSIGASVSSTLWERWAQTAQALLSENLNLDAIPVLSSAASRLPIGLHAEGFYALLQGLVQAQGLFVGANQLFRWASLGLLCNILIIWWVKPAPGITPHATATRNALPIDAH